MSTRHSTAARPCRSVIQMCSTHHGSRTHSANSMASALAAAFPAVFNQKYLGTLRSWILQFFCEQLWWLHCSCPAFCRALTQPSSYFACLSRFSGPGNARRIDLGFLVFDFAPWLGRWFNSVCQTDPDPSLYHHTDLYQSFSFVLSWLGSGSGWRAMLIRPFCPWTVWLGIL